MLLPAIPFPAIDPVLIAFGPLQIHWYGLGYILGILFAWWYATRLLTNTTLWNGATAPIKPLDLSDFITWAVVGIILGGRLGYVFFYDFAQFIANPASIFAVWNGGMSFHGGLIGLLIAMIWFSRRRGFSPFHLFDVVTASAGIGIMLVRITNFINGELFGKTTNVAWGVIFPNGGPEPRHPSQIYEAMLEGLVMFFVLRIITHNFKKLNHAGFVAGCFLIWYALSRILIEFVRVPDAQLGYLFGGWLTMGMVLSIPMALVGIWAIVTSHNRVLQPISK